MSKILIVDDTRIIREGMVRFLEYAFECAVDEACDGLEALAKLESSNYSLVLMDYEMPTINGFECVAKIREIEKVTGIHTPIIGMSASQKLDIKEKCMQAGMNGYLSKECSNKEIEDEVRKWVVQNH
jgi:CheY-like chemotaxis protein